MTANGRLRGMVSADWLRPSVIALVVSNLVPLVGVFVYGWDAFTLVLLFWLENIVVGVLNVVRMVLAAPHGRAGLAGKAGLILFFLVHYGLFTMIHGLMLITVFGKLAGGEAAVAAEAVGRDGPLALPSTVLFLVREYTLGWPLAALAASHVISLLTNYLAKGEYRRITASELMARPYGRIVILHVAVLVGGILATLTGSHRVALVVLVALKIVVDVHAHLAERRRLAGSESRDRAP